MIICGTIAIGAAIIAWRSFEQGELYFGVIAALYAIGFAWCAFAETTQN